MRKPVLFNVICFAVLVPSVSKDLSDKIILREKRQNDRWVWGIAETGNEPDKKTTIEPDVSPPAYDRGSNEPCAPYTPTMPNFNKPGRRISEAKCDQYIWKLKYRAEKKKRYEDCSRQDFHVAVVGGRDALPGEFPHMAAIGWKATTGTWVFKCGGSLISSKFVLTAAHCSKTSDRDTTVADPVPKMVRLGIRNILVNEENGEDPLNINIMRIIPHPNYTSPKKYNDIALLELQDNVVFSKFKQPACLWSNTQSNFGTEVTVTGWGVTKSGGQTSSPVLQAALLNAVDISTCDAQLQPLCNRNWCGVSESQLCAGKLAGGVDACQQSDRWVWGVADTERNSKLRVGSDILPVSGNTTGEDNPCAPYTPTKPNFSKPGRRISDIKCYEYIWHINYRAERDKRKSTCKGSNSIRRRLHKPVVGGHNTAPDEFPHMGAIGWKLLNNTWTFKCGGSLISSKFLLTAAHCTRASERDTSIADPVPKIVRLGDKNIINPRTAPFDVNIARIVVHPQYASPKKYYDIALIELVKEVEFTKNIQPACLWSNSLSNSLGSQANVTGWGAIEPGGTSSPELQVALVDIISTEQCDQLLTSACNRLWCGVQGHQMCAGKLVGGVDTCQGDSGGPLQVKIPIPVNSQGGLHYIVGVTSFGVGCARPNTPGVYVKVSSFMDWIEAITWE